MQLIVACDINGAIGKNNELPWKLSDDLKLFKKITSGFPILMGRKTAESLGRALPNRTNLVLSTNPDLKLEGFTAYTSLEKAYNDYKHLFVIGGDQIYKLALQNPKLISDIHLTFVYTSIKDADAYLNLQQLEQITKDFKLLEEKNFTINDKNEFNFRYCHFKRV